MTPILPPDKLREILDSYADLRQKNRDNYGTGMADVYKGILRVTIAQLEQLATAALVAELGNLLVIPRIITTAGGKVHQGVPVERIDERISELQRENK